MFYYDSYQGPAKLTLVRNAAANITLAVGLVLASTVEMNTIDSGAQSSGGDVSDYGDRYEPKD
jgi:hypothetical protein